MVRAPAAIQDLLKKYAGQLRKAVLLYFYGYGLCRLQPWLCLIKP
jgi:hypothetical protein